MQQNSARSVDRLPSVVLSILSASRQIQKDCSENEGAVVENEIDLDKELIQSDKPASDDGGNSPAVRDNQFLATAIYEKQMLVEPSSF